LAQLFLARSAIGSASHLRRRFSGGRQSGLRGHGAAMRVGAQFASLVLARLLAGATAAAIIPLWSRDAAT